MSMLGATILTAIATAVLAAGALVTAVFAFLAFGKQSGQLEVQRKQLDDQRKANVRQAEAFESSLRNRRDDIAREEASWVRARVWEILNGDSDLRPLRTVQALHEKDETGRRVKFLARTPVQLDVAGAAMLGNKLRAVLDQEWGTGTDKQSESARDDFVQSAKQFMNPAPDDSASASRDIVGPGDQPAQPPR